MCPARTSGINSSVALLNLDSTLAYLVEHIILIVSCVYAASQDSKALYLASVFVALVSSYNWMLSILRPPPSVAAWMALSDTHRSTASRVSDGAFDYFVEHVMLLVCCVHAASQNSEDFFTTALYMLLISSYTYIQPVLQYSPSVTPRRMISEFSNCNEPFEMHRGLLPDTPSSSPDGGLEVSNHRTDSTQRKDHSPGTGHFDVVGDVAPEAGVCDAVAHPPLLEIDPDISTTDVQSVDADCLPLSWPSESKRKDAAETHDGDFGLSAPLSDTRSDEGAEELSKQSSDQEVVDPGLDMKDVRLVMSEADVSMKLAIAALKEIDNDLLNSIMWATSEFEGSRLAQTPVNDGQTGRFEHDFAPLPRCQEQSPQVMTDEATVSEESQVTDTKTKSRSKERRAARQRERRANERLRKRVFGAANLRQSATFAEQMSLDGWTLVDPVHFAIQLCDLLPHQMSEATLQELVDEGPTTHGRCILELASSWRMDGTERKSLRGESRESRERDERKRLLVKNTWVERFWKVSE